MSQFINIILFSVINYLKINLMDFELWILPLGHFISRDVARLFPRCLETPPLAPLQLKAEMGLKSHCSHTLDSTIYNYCMHTHVNIHQLYTTCGFEETGMKRL